MKSYKFCAVPVSMLVLGGLCSTGLAQTPVAKAPATPPPASQAQANEAPAADRPSREDVLKMFEAMHVRKQMDQMMRLMANQTRQQLHTALQKQSPALSPEEQRKLESQAADAMTIYPIEEMMEDMVPIYQRHMSKTDVDAIIRFYASPAGQHLLDQQPVMIQESMSTIMPKINARMQAYIAKVTKESDAPIPVPSNSASPSAPPASSGTPAPPPSSQPK